MSKLRIKKQALKNHLKEIIEDGCIKELIIQKIESAYTGPEWSDEDECDLDDQIESFLDEVILKIKTIK